MTNSRYSLIRYSLGSDAAEIRLTMSGVATLNCVSKFAGNILVGNRFEEKAQGNARATLAFYEHFFCAETLSARVAGDVALNLGRVGLREDLSSNNLIVADIHTDQTMEDALTGYAYLATCMQIGIAGVGRMKGNLQAATNLQINSVYSEVLGSNLLVINLEREIMVLNVTIPPGGRLIIDSDLYTMTLNDDNVIDLHSGDWIWLDRNLIELDVDSGTGGDITGKVICSERYL